MKSTFHTLWHLLKDYHRSVYMLCGTIVVYELLKLAPAAVLAIVIDTIIVYDPSHLPMLGWSIAGLFIASMCVSFLEVHLEFRIVSIDYEAMVSLLKRIAEKLLRLPIGYHEKHNTGATVNTLHKGIDHLGILIYYMGKDLIPTCVQLLLTFGILLWVGLLPGLIFAVFLPVFLYILHQYGKRVQPLRKDYHEKMDLAAGHIGERIMNIRTVQDFAVEKRELQGYSSILEDYLELGKKRMQFHRVYFLYRDTAMNFSRIIIMGLGIWMVATGDMTPGTLVFFITLSEKANIALFRLINLYNQVGDSMESIRRVVKLFVEEEAIVEIENPKDVGVLRGDLQFENVTFSYTENLPVLKDVSFSIQPKTMLAIIGKSGAGKSTIVKLLYRHFDVTKGTLNVDGTDIREYKLKDYRRQFALVPQDIEIFNATVRENISFGNPEATQEEIEKAAKIAYAHEFIEEFPDSYNTLVGERGVRLSGGQKQRIGIARAILANPSILIFDEATSSLDTESEQLIQKAMEEIAKDYTMIVIAHRLSTIEHADQVIVLENGEIVEQGSHIDLINQGGVYQKMRELQRLGEVRE